MSVRSALREEFTPGSVLLLVVLGAGLLRFTDVSPAYLAYVAVLAVGGSLLAELVGVSNVDGRLAEVAFGLVILAAAGVWAWGRLDAGESLLAPAVGAAIGCWVALDGVANYRAGLRRDDSAEPDWDPGALEGARFMYQGSEAVQELDADRPRTVASVAASIDADHDRVAEFFEMAASQGVLERREDGYVVSPAHDGKWRSTLTNVRGIARRIARPVAILTGRWSGSGTSG